MGPCAVAILFCLCLLPSSATPETAIGFSPFQSTFRSIEGLSLWRVKPRSMIGVGLGLNWFSSGDSLGRKRTSKSVAPSLMVIQIYRPDELAPLSYQKVSAGIIGTTNTVDFKQREWYAEGEIGLGIIWRPPKKNISLSLQQGIFLNYLKDTREKKLEEGSRLTSSSWSNWSARARKSARLLVTFSF